MKMMSGKPMDPMDAKRKAIEELMAHLDGKDGEELGSAMKPKEVEIEVEAPGAEALGDEAPGAEVALGEESKPKMSEEEMAELIEAIQSKLG